MSEPHKPDRAAVIHALNAIADPKTGQGLVAAGRIHGLALEPGRVRFVLEAPPGEGEAYLPVREAAEAALAALEGVEAVQAVLTSESKAAPAPHAAPRRAQLAEEPQGRAPTGVEKPANVKRMIAVASGKGGVGKSTVAVNLAAAFAGLGYAVGLIDADVHGPSAPRMLGLSDRPAFDANRKLIPLEAHGLQAISIGFMAEEGQALVWRGPMASQAVRQMVQDVVWGQPGQPLDVLVVDLPPGTGDVVLSLLQKLTLDGVVIVSTPQEVALADVRRAAALFDKFKTPILGVIENMAYFENPTTGEAIPIFGRGGAAAEAGRMGVPVLAEVPIDIALREACDDGQPLTAVTPDSPAAKALIAAAKTIAAGWSD
jgi:ATP-binding protein involved in chromosome partitioning